MFCKLLFKYVMKIQVSFDRLPRHIFSLKVDMLELDMARLTHLSPKRLNVLLKVSIISFKNASKPHHIYMFLREGLYSDSSYF